MIAASMHISFLQLFLTICICSCVIILHKINKNKVNVEDGNKIFSIRQAANFHHEATLNLTEPLEVVVFCNLWMILEYTPNNL